MTENADVEWLRAKFGNCLNPIDQCSAKNWITCGRASRILAHIDQLEAENARLIEVAEDKIDINVRPTIHEIAAQIMAAYVSGQQYDHPASDRAKWAYDDAEALVAEGRRRDGQA